MNSVLQQIAQRKHEEVAFAKKNKPLTSFNQQSSPARDFIKALQLASPLAIIAEIKKASPSKGIIREDFDVARIASLYEAHGAACLSVLTDIDFFQGHPDNLALAKNHCQLPVLRKDFIIDAYQIHESLALGADCILLIVALLDPIQLKDYCQQAQELNMAVLVESHTEDELDIAITLPTPLIGINNRSLHSFKTSLQTSVELQKRVPKDKIIISESGINTYEDIKLMQSYGINSFLVGESLMRASDIGMALDDLINNQD